MKRGMTILLGVAAGTMLLGMATPFAWADGGTAKPSGNNMVLSREQSITLFRILQESLTSVARHAQATNVHITYDPTVSYSLYSMTPHKLYVNFGFWDVVESDHEEGYFNKAIENKVRKLDGRKSLYSISFYSREEFGQLYNEQGYRQLEARYDSTGKLNNLFEKCMLKK